MTKKSVIKIWILIAIITVISFSDWTFAADGETESLKEVAWLLNAIVSILSWIWVWFAKWAWEFLTNKWVYGEVLWLDAILWKWWNIMKNMANFWLWFYFVYLILKELMGNITGWAIGSSGTKSIKNQILWILIAWIGIQASWFMTAVVVDVSTITLVAAGSLPSQVVSEYPKLEEDFNFAINDYLELEVNDGKTFWDVVKGVQYSIFSPNETKKSFITEIRTVPLDRKITRKELFDEIMPNADNVSGPLYYLWFAILNATRVVSVDSSGENSRKSTIFTTLLQWWTTIIYSIEMLVLFIFVVMRAAYMWMFIVLSPLVVLLRCINKSSKSKSWGEWLLSKMKNNISFGSFFWNAFKPTIIVLWFAFAMIFVTLIEGVILHSAQRTIDLWWVTTFSYKEGESNNGDRGNQTYTSAIDSNVMGITIAHAWKTLLEFILSIITVILVYYIIKFAVNMWWSNNDFLTKKIGSIQGTVDQFLTEAPLIPAVVRDEDWKVISKWISRSALSSLPGKKFQNVLDEYKSKDDETVDSFMKWAWLQDDNSFSVTEKSTIRSTWINSSWLGILEAKRDYIKTISTEQWKWAILNPNASDKTRQNEFTGWLTKMETKTGEITWQYKNEWTNMINRRNTHKNDRTLEKMFKQNNSGQEKSVAAYAALFWLQWTIKTREDLMNKDISSRNDTKQKQWEESEEWSN